MHSRERLEFYTMWNDQMAFEAYRAETPSYDDIGPADVDYSRSSRLAYKRMAYNDEDIDDGAEYYESSDDYLNYEDNDCDEPENDSDCDGNDSI